MSRRPGARFPSVITSAGVAAEPAAARDDAARRGGFRRRMASRRVGVAMLATALGAGGAAGCASGTDAMTNSARTTTNSVAGAVGPITLRNVYVAGPVAQGESAQVVSAFFNAGSTPDTLVSVTSPGAAGGRPPTPAEIPAGGDRIFIANGSAPSLQGVRKNQLIGSQLPITFTFAHAGSVTLDVPVEPAAQGASAEPGEASPSAAAQTPGTATPGSTASPTASPTVPAGTAATPTVSASPHTTTG
ncbi:putative lipoprotein [Frankia canadensis]|uniref:Putative lipoprotein n=1 Tax=Frankia canadensis TaxID=1836972 RepID=A0A2I2KYB8_9ACTN|nr:hypothetical protein [Frankia canadensis]SNQ50649.1 putative lipoprotein [Frankia canadensis]SOU57939.1 putative lipoprotein [Frankia canadensis]